MSRIMGDALVAGPESTSAPEMVTVRLTRGQAEAFAASAEHMREVMRPFPRVASFDTDDVEFLSRAIDALRAQIGGSR